MPTEGGCDIALIWNGETGQAECAIAGGDFVMDAGLRTAVIISLFTDALADPSDSLPDGTDDRRGWVGDVPPSGSADGVTDPIGSTLWLYEGQRQTEPIRRRIEVSARDALAWMIRDRVADAVDVTATYPFRDRVDLAVTIRQGTVTHRYDLNWKAT